VISRSVATSPDTTPSHVASSDDKLDDKDDTG
jgi:hypothetical protein